MRLPASALGVGLGSLLPLAREGPAERRRRRRRLRAVRTLSFGTAALLAWRSVQAWGFVTGASVQGAGSATASGAASARGGRTRLARQFFGDSKDYEAEEQARLEAFKYPEDQMWKVSGDGSKIREVYEGARNPGSVFFSIFQPGASIGFLIVGLSTLLLENGYPAIVDVSAWTKEAFPYLRPGMDTAWFPQGMFLTFYGLFGTFIFGPFQWWLMLFNKGKGCAEFDNKNKSLSIVKDDELISEVPFENIDTVVFEWSNTGLGARTIYLLLKDDNGRIDFMSPNGEYSKQVMEKKASVLSDFLKKELVVVE
uniref:Photosystem I assembly protein Ycf4 n=1 Tax=Zooxanthella nutricula TaxID=1333877 RepID=A0A7S2QGX3_9DINO